MGKKVILLLLMTLFVFSFVSAKQVIQIGTGEGGQIFYPEINNHKINTEYDFHIHVSNSSDNRQLNNTEVDCFIHIYNSTGSHVYENGALGKDNNGIDHELYLLPGNFSDEGVHSIAVWCNGSLDAETKISFDVSKVGFELSTAQAILYAISFMFLFLIFVLLLYGREALPRDVKDDKGKILQVSQLEALRPILLAMAWIVLTAMTFIVANIMIAYMQTGLMGAAVFGIFQLMMLSNLLIIPMAFIWMFQRIALSKEIMDSINGGVSVYAK